MNDFTYLCYVITQDGNKIDPNKVEEIMDHGRPTTMTDVQALISIIRYYMDICPRKYHRLSPLIDADSGPTIGKHFGILHYKGPLCSLIACSMMRTY